MKKEIPKNIELSNAIATEIDSNLDYGEKIRLTPLSKNIKLGNGNSPHVHTVKAKLMEAEQWKNVANNINFHYKRNNEGEQELYEIEKTSPKKSDIELILGRLLRLEKQDDEIFKLLKEISEIIKKFKQ